VTGGLLGLLPALRTLMPADPLEFIPFTWTLRLEMAFYIAVTVALIAANKTGSRFVVPVAIAAAYFASVAALLCGRHGILSTAPMFLTGLAIWRLGAARGPARWILLTAVLPAFWLGFLSLGQYPHPARVAQFAVLAGLIGLFAALSATKAPATWKSLDRRLGDLSYPLYLNHYVVGVVLTDLCTYRGVPLYVLAAALSVALASGMASAVDRPLMSLRNRLRRQVL
jgi:peptidoglycan/LPS O-acetylase OafA/YrhL